MRIVVLGGDGYLGWPSALHLSASGHEVAVALAASVCSTTDIDHLRRES